MKSKEQAIMETIFVSFYNALSISIIILLFALALGYYVIHSIVISLNEHSQENIFGSKANCLFLVKTDLYKIETHYLGTLNYDVIYQASNLITSYNEKQPYIYQTIIKKSFYQQEKRWQILNEFQIDPLKLLKQNDNMLLAYELDKIMLSDQLIWSQLQKKVWLIKQ